MRLHNWRFPEFDVIGDRSFDARVVIRMSTGAEGVFFRLRDVTVDLDSNDAGLEFNLLTDSDSNRVRVFNGVGQQPARFYSSDVGGNPILSVYYGDGNQGTQSGRFEATLEFSFDDVVWRPLKEWPGTVEVNPGSFLAIDGGSNPDCFWTELKGVTQDCGRLPPVSDWTAGGTNGRISISSPPSVVNRARVPLGYDASHDGFGPLSSFAHTLHTELFYGAFHEAYGAGPRTYTGHFLNVRIVRLHPSSGDILETFPIDGMFPVSVVGQEVNANGDTFIASFDGDLPSLDRAFAWGVVADLALDSSDPAGKPIRVTFGSPYTFVVPTVFIVETQEFAFPQGSASEEEIFYFHYSAWAELLPCGDGATLTIRVDGGEPKRLTFYHGCH